MKPLGELILRGRLQAALMLSATGLLAFVLPPFTLFGGAIMTLIALQNDAKESLFSLGLSSLLSLILLGLTVGQPQLLLVLLAIWLPVAICAAVLRASHSLPLALLVAALFTEAAVLLIYMLVPAPAVFWEETLMQLFASADLGEQRAEFEARISATARFMTGAFAAGYLINIAVCLFIGRWWQAKLFSPGSFRREFYALRFGKALAIVVGILSVVVMFFEIEVITAVLLVLVVLYFLQGLSLVHVLNNAKSKNAVWLVVFYVALVVLRPTFFMVTLLGLADSWLDIRKRWLAVLPDNTK